MQNLRDGIANSFYLAIALVTFRSLTMLVLLFAVLLLLPCSLFAQFPAVCNTPDSLRTKTCCPNNCGGPTRGNCQNITARVVAQWELADSEVNEILQNTPNEPQKGTADARYLWPAVVFEWICVCSGNYGGVDCSECDFGWTGYDCSTRKTFSNSSQELQPSHYRRETDFDQCNQRP